LKYKNLNIAFLFEICVGFGTILSIALLGPKGIAALSLMILRPIMLEREKIENSKDYFKYFYKILSSSLTIIFIMIVSIIIIIQFIPSYKAKLPSIDILFIIILPFFLLTHGVIGIINSSNMEQDK
jgi:cation transporter-like permease